MKEHRINVGIIGFGTVGTGVARVLIEQNELLKTRSGIEFKLKAIVDLDWERDRNLELSDVKCSTNIDDVLDDPEIDIVVETIGGYEPAFTFICRALRNHKYVITANKALIASKGRELFDIAKQNQVEILFEASVGGGIPIIKALREGLVANKIESVYGILNGTSNYILTKMHEEDVEFSEALKDAQKEGFAEADPTLDIGGGDAAHKLAIIASLASSTFVDVNKLYVEGITEISKLDIGFARNFGYSIKLLAIYQLYDNGLGLRVHPTLVPNTHLLAAVSNELNAVFLKGDFVGETMFYGPGAGERPTASAIVSDIVDVSRNLLLREEGYSSSREINTSMDINLIPIHQVSNRFYLRFFTLDIPGVLSKISGVLGEYGISISSMVQLEKLEKDHYIPIVLLTHEASEKAMEEALKVISEFEFVKENYLRLRLF